MKVMYPKKVAIGVDIGGTKVKAGLVTIDGQTIGVPESIRTQSHEAGEIIIKRLISLIQRMIQQAKGMELVGIGIGSTGPLDIDNGIILECNNLPTLHNYPLKSKLESTFSLPVRLNNDANAMMLGEAIWGAGKNINSILGITLGTGLGAALIVDRKIIRGATGCAGEIWLSPYKDGMIEDYVSGTAISHLYKEITQKEITGEEISKLAREGDVHALKVWEEFTQALAYALSWAVNITDPEAVIFGGSVMDSSDIFWNPMVSIFKKHICPQTAAHIQLKPSGLKDNAGFMGAAALIFIE